MSRLTKGSLFLLVLLCLLEAAIAAETPFDRNSRFRLTYKVEVKPHPSGKKKISLWVPFPSEDESQKILTFRPESPWSFELRREAKFGNKMLYLQGMLRKKTVFSFEYEIERHPRGTIKTKEENLSLYLEPNRLIPIFSPIAEIAKKEAGHLEENQAKIRMLYRYVVSVMRYDKSGEGWGKGDSVFACEAKRGNCTDFHSLFIALSRSLGIPARFEIGLPIPLEIQKGEIAGYHCWAEAYVSNSGWIPVDASEAKKNGKIDEYFGHLPSDRIHFMTGRDLVLSPPQKGEALNYFIYPYAEADGTPFEGVTQNFTFEKLL